MNGILGEIEGVCVIPEDGEIDELVLLAKAAGWGIFVEKVSDPFVIEFGTGRDFVSGFEVTSCSSFLFEWFVVTFDNVVTVDVEAEPKFIKFDKVGARAGRGLLISCSGCEVFEIGDNLGTCC